VIAKAGRWTACSVHFLSHFVFSVDRARDIISYPGCAPVIMAFGYISVPFHFKNYLIPSMGKQSYNSKQQQQVAAPK
jgi:hypothetical protein